MSFTYKGLSAQLNRHIVTYEEITRQLQRLAEQNPRIAKITDRPTELGDEVVLDYAGFCDGEQFAGGTAENQTLVLGSGMFIPGFEEQLLDKVVEEKVTVKVTFPTEYHSADLAGKEAEFKCVIHEIRVKTPYQLDDVFAKEVGQCETLDEMREKLGASMQAYSDERAEMDLQDRLLRLSSATLEVAFTDDQIEAAVDQQMKVLEAQLARQGLNIDMYCSFMNTTAEDLRRDARPTAEATLLNQAAIDMIIDLEGLQAEEAEIAEALAVICRQNNMTMEQMQSYYDAEFEKAVIKSVLTSKALRLIRDASNIAVADN